MAGVQVGRQLVAGMRSQAENRKILSPQSRVGPAVRKNADSLEPYFNI